MGDETEMDLDSPPNMVVDVLSCSSVGADNSHVIHNTPTALMTSVDCATAAHLISPNIQRFFGVAFEPKEQAGPLTPRSSEAENQSSSKSSHNVVRHLEHNQDRRTYTTKLRGLGPRSNSNPNSQRPKIGRSNSNSKNGIGKLKNRFPRKKASHDDLTYDAEDEHCSGSSSASLQVPKIPHTSFTPCGFDIDELKEHVLIEDEQNVWPCDASPKSQAEQLQQSDTNHVSEYLSPRSNEVVLLPAAVNAPNKYGRGSINCARDSMKLKSRSRKKK